MFEKLLATLPYNPGLAHQVAFYGRRMHEEASIRRTGLIFMVLAFMIQFFAVLNPPQPASAAASPNDLVYGGISSGQEAAVACHNNTRRYGEIMGYYGIPCGALKDAPVMHINEHDFNNNLYSLGNNPYGKPGETAMTINGNKVFWRYLWSWNINKPIKVLKVVAHGKTFFVMFDCGNLVSVGIPPPAPVGLGPAKPLTPPVSVGPAVPVSKPPAATPAPAVTTTTTTTTTKTPCPYDNSITADNASCRPCDQSTNSQDAAACISISKTAVNNTQGLGDANGTVANPGDVITYTLFAKNNGKATVKNYIFEEHMSDVLDYAEITELRGGNLDTGNGVVTWPAISIKPGETAAQKVVVRVKNPLPGHPVSPSDPAHFDLIMTNVYGNTINIRLPGSPEKTVEAAAATLPNTGPGTTLIIGSVIVIAAGYFYGRARLLTRESKLAIQETVGV